MGSKIQGIIIGWGEGSRRYFVSGIKGIAKIERAWKNIGPHEIMVYRVYNTKEEIAFEIEAGSGVTLTYFND